MLKIENITYSYKRSKQAVLSNYSLEVKDGTALYADYWEKTAQGNLRCFILYLDY